MCDCNPGTNENSAPMMLPGSIDLERRNRIIQVDACIADVIQHLWDNGIETWGCCCGHNKVCPVIDVNPRLTMSECATILRIIKEVDDREWATGQFLPPTDSEPGFRRHIFTTAFDAKYPESMMKHRTEPIYPKAYRQPLCDDANDDLGNGGSNFQC